MPRSLVRSRLIKYNTGCERVQTMTERPLGDSLPDTFHSRDQKPGFSVDEMSFHASGSLKSSDPPAQTAKNLVSLPKFPVANLL